MLAERCRVDRIEEFDVNNQEELIHELLVDLKQFFFFYAEIAQQVEQSSRKRQVAGSIPVFSTRFKDNSNNYVSSFNMLKL